MIKRINIQIIRALAVIFVVLFHLEIAGIKSGFLGVDVFFVVSGFLMALLYKKGEAKNFFERRAKRLLPAYFATVILTLFASLFLIFPSELGQVNTQAIYSLFFSSNIGFWMQSSYFNKADFNPLLHLWSLGVEIQFYLIVPLLVWFFRKSKFFLFLALLGSFATCVFIVGISPKTSFFMMPLRMWEFLLGFVVAYYLTINGVIKYKNFSWLGCIGLLVLCVIPFVNIDGEALNRLQAHPSFYALLVCISTCLVLAFGLPKILENNAISEVFVKIGDYSYSIYLVHFPIIVLYLYTPFSGTKLYPESAIDKAILLILIIIFSFLMYNLVEKRKFGNIGKVYLTSLVSLLLLTGANRIVPEMYNQQDQNIFNSLNDRSTYRCGKIVRITDPNAISCKINTEYFAQSILLVGNSHADAIKTTLSSVAMQHKYNTYFFSQ
jgi:peptidoglycan/LPS O-acetylase OafA/YrhL